MYITVHTLDGEPLSCAPSSFLEGAKNNFGKIKAWTNSPLALEYKILAQLFPNFSKILKRKKLCTK